MALPREDFLDAPADEVETTLPPRRTGRIRRPLNGGWTLMIAAGVIAATANYALLTMGEPAVEVAVLTAAAPAGTPLDQLAIEMTPLPIADPAAARLLAGPDALEAVADQVTAVRLEAGVLLRSTDLRVASGEGLSAMSVPIDVARAVGGVLQAGDRVDVIAGAEQADYVVRDVQVVEVVEPSSGIGAGTASPSLTLSVDGEQALRLAQALRDGEIDLVRTASGDGGGG